MSRPCTEVLLEALRGLPEYSAVLLDSPIHQMIARAEAGYYHDYKSPHPTPSLVLMSDLKAIGADELIARHINGEFDATREESDEWAASPDGQAVFAELAKSLGS